MVEEDPNYKCYVEKSKTADYTDSAMGNSNPKVLSSHNMMLRLTGQLNKPPVDLAFEAFNWRGKNPYNPNTRYCGGGGRRRSRKYRKSSRRVFRKKTRATRRRR